MQEVGVAVPCYQHGKYLGQMLESLRLQSYGAWQCVVVIDGPDAEAETVAVQHMRHDPRIRVVILQKRAGEAAARNLAIRDLRTPWIMPFDADDWMDGDHLHNLMRMATDIPHPEGRYNVFFSPARLVYDDGRKTVYTYPPYDPETIADQVQLPGSSLYPRALYDRLRGYDEQWNRGATDWMFYVRATQLGILNPVQVFPSSWNYRQHSGYRAHREGALHLEVLKREMRRALRGERAFGEPLVL